MFGNLNIICIITVKAANTNSAREFKNAKKTAGDSGRIPFRTGIKFLYALEIFGRKVVSSYRFITFVIRITLNFGIRT